MSKSGKRKKGGPGGPGGSPRPSAPPNPMAASAPTPPAAPKVAGVLRSPLFDMVSQSPDLEPLLPDKAGRVPMEYRAQTKGRSQRQYIKEQKNAPPSWRSDLQMWIDQWVERVDGQCPFSSEGLHVVEATIDWRLISNSGVDDGVIRPVIGAGGWPLVPGSGIKGLFRRACPPERLERWCGSPSKSKEDGLQPGLLRFHGAWPADPSWMKDLLDVAHPQQNWQVGFERDQRNNKHSAFGVVSLLRPRLLIGISSTDPQLSPGEWEEIDATLKGALRAGIGGRTCAGYGSSGRLAGQLVFECGLEGQGPAAKLLDKTPEFRPTMFRAAIRGMALRLFGGLTDERNSLQAVGRLFGDLSGKEGQHVGLVATAFTDASVALGSYGSGSWEQPTYHASGQLQWRLARSCSRGEDEQLLAELIGALHGITMAVAGFGRSWRRPDHQIFYTAYGKTPIGCHWQWQEPTRLPKEIFVQSPQQLAALLKRACQLGEQWLKQTGQLGGEPAPWREVIHPDRMLIWTRRADNTDDAAAIRWFHRAPQNSGSDDHDPLELKGGELAGRMNHVGRIWNRMLPLIEAGAPSGGSAPRPANPMARPANPMARPANPTARPRAGRSTAPALRGTVGIKDHPSAFLETLVLFPKQIDSRAFVAAMDQGANAAFNRLHWSA